MFCQRFFFVRCVFLSLFFRNILGEEIEESLDSINVGDTSVISENGNLTFTNLRKCWCQANEVWINDGCQVRENGTEIQVLIDVHPPRYETISTDIVTNVEVSGIACPPNYFNVTLSGQSFALKMSGQLYNAVHDISFNVSNYCVEHVYENDRINLLVNLCIPIPKVPSCCPDDYYDRFNNVCNYQNNSSVSVQFTLGEKEIHANAETFSNILKCQNSDDDDVGVKSFASMVQDRGTAELKLSEYGLELVHQVSYVGDMVFIPPTEYCLQIENDRIIQAVYCFEDLLLKHNRECEDQVCIRKCCPPHQIYDLDSYRCVSASQDYLWAPEFFDDQDITKRIAAPENVKLMIGFPVNCQFYHISPTNDPKDIFEIISTGSIIHKQKDHQTIVPSSHYCLDNFVYENTYEKSGFVCFHKQQESSTCTQAKTILDPILLLTSCIFLVVTLIVYAIIPDLHVKVQGKCLMANVSSLLVGYICLVIIQLYYDIVWMPGCIALGLMLQFSILASFFWLNVMCYDIWRTLRSVNTGRESPTSSRTRYLKYSLYAWGCPFIIFVVTLIMQTLNVSKEDTNLILPRIGDTMCFFPPQDTKAIWIYMFGFVSVLLVINLCFFIHLAVLLLKVQKFTESALGNRNQRHKEWAKLYLKLFFVMGITWVFEVTSWIDGSCGVWITTDIVNALRGLLIFIIFVCKRDVLKKLMKRGSPAFNRMTSTMRRQSSSMFSRSSKRTSNFYVDPSSSGRINNDEIHSGNDDNDVVL